LDSFVETEITFDSALHITAGDVTVNSQPATYHEHHFDASLTSVVLDG